tara:strand:+ start:198 stop:764 length:567 start_codon:yes stop_codon:yes gene_type:complete
MIMHKIKQVIYMDSTYLSKEELEAAVSALSDADILRLTEIARIYTGNHEMEADDLVQEAVIRTLSGDRKTCPRNLPIVNFLVGVMRSIASSEREKKEREGDSCDIEKCQVADPDSSPEDDVLEKQLFKELEIIFEEDEEILMLMLYLHDGHSPAEIQKNEEWSETQYNTIRRRMRRKFNAHTEQEHTS